MRPRSQSLAEHGITWTEDGAPSGFQVGKAAAMLDAMHRREEQEYERLFAELEARNVTLSARAKAAAWMRQRRKEQPERVAEYLRRWRARNRETYLRQAREAQRKRYEAKRRECRCDQCGKRWTPRPRWTGEVAPSTRAARFCSRRCANAWHGSRRKPRSRGIRQMDVARVVERTLRRDPWLTPREVAERAAEHRTAGKRVALKPGSVATLLCVWRQRGLVVRRKTPGERSYRYKWRTP